jgi:hypothetical protein
MRLTFALILVSACTQATDSMSAEQALNGQGCTVNAPDPRACDPADTKKTTVCHIPPGNPANAHTICVGNDAVPAHLDHGDFVGTCSCDGSGSGSGSDTGSGSGSGSDGTVL